MAPAVNEKDGGVAGDIAIESGNLALESEKRIDDGDLAQEILLGADVFIRDSENN